MADLGSIVAKELLVKRHRTFDENLEVAAKAINALTGYTGSLTDKAQTSEFFDKFNLTPITAYGIKGVGLKVSYKWHQDQEAPKPKVTSNQSSRSVGGPGPASKSYDAW